MTHSTQPSLRDDAAIDRAAKAYAFEHNVSYSEALGRVASGIVDFERPASTVDLGDGSDADLDRKARAYAAERGVNYAEAIGAVCAARAGGSHAVPAFAERAGSSADAELDRRAHAYARERGVSYSEALGAVAAGGANFAEATFGGPVAAMESSLIEIFAAGTHRTDQGETYTYTRSDLEAIAAGYDPAKREAPLVVGHPETDAPARGWVKSVHVTSGGKLAVRVHRVARDFAEAVAQGRFRKRSASFYAPGDFRNPTPGAWYLRHVGWLGAMQPSVSGLADLQFGEGVGHTGLGGQAGGGRAVVAFTFGE